MSLPYKNGLVECARELRKNATRQERHLWFDFLRNYPIRFQRQKIIEGSIVDFYCSTANLAIELDGSQHYDEVKAKKDQQRTSELNALNVMVLRFSNLEVDREFAAVCVQIDRFVKERTAVK